MQQLVCRSANGQLELVDIPVPAVRPGQVLIANRFSLISAGTERSIRQLARKSLLGKARARPEQVRRVLEKVRTDGLRETVKQVREKLDQPSQLGYCSAGVVLACGAGVQAFKPGDRVSSNGPHAEAVCVPMHLCAQVPESVALDEAAFAVLGAIAMQGMRLSKLALGETALVIGLGLVGQVTVALLGAAGVRVIGTDLEPAKCDLARRLGAEVARPGICGHDVSALTGGLGADAVLIAASTKSNAPVELAADAVRQKGRVVAIGEVAMGLPREPFYCKEAEFVVSCSYGPGRYDPRYEERGQDYPSAYVRWTENRNMQAVLDLLASGKIDFKPLISHRFPIEKFDEAYQLIDSGGAPCIGVVLQYREDPPRYSANRIELRAEPLANGVGIGCLGAGDFARAVLLPKLCSLPEVRPEILCSAGGKSAAYSGKRLQFAEVSSDEQKVFESDRVDAVVVATRHDQHARQVVQALRARKHVFVEKPLCLTIAELVEIEAELLAAACPQIVMVGFNRRFSPAARAVRKFFADCMQPITVSVRVNAGEVPSEHWTQDESVGGGRVIGEACHAIDLATYLTGSVPLRVYAESIAGTNAPEIRDDQCFLTMRHANGSISNISYLAGGDRSFPKERVEVFGGGRVAVIDDFRSAEAFVGGRNKRLFRGKQDKGHAAELQAFIDAVYRGGDWPIPWSEIWATTWASLLAVTSIREGSPMEIPSTCGAPTENEAMRLVG